MDTAGQKLSETEGGEDGQEAFFLEVDVGKDFGRKDWVFGEDEVNKAEWIKEGKENKRRSDKKKM